MSNKKILIIGPAWVGDMVMAQALFKLIKQQNPATIIDVLAPAWSRPLLARMPEVRQALVMPLGHRQLQLKLRWQLGKALRAEKYDQAIVLPNSWKSAFVPFAASIPQRTGWLGELRYGLLNDYRHLDKQQVPLMVERFLLLGLPTNSSIPANWQRPQLQLDLSVTKTTLNKFNLNTDKPVLALCPGAEFGPAKRWPTKHFAVVAQEKIAEGWQIWLFGSAKDQAVAYEIQQNTNNHCIDFTGKTSLGEAIDLISLTKVVVSNDSGLMHIAAALQRPSVVLYGSSTPYFTPPLSDRVKILSLNLACSPCFKRECPLVHLNCLQQLMPVNVLDAIDQLTK